MTCPNCKSDNVTVTIEQVGANEKRYGKGCLWSIGRAALIVCTVGIWLLISKRKGKSKTTFENATVAICQNCGNKWTVKK